MLQWHPKQHSFNTKCGEEVTHKQERAPNQLDLLLKIDPLEWN